MKNNKLIEYLQENYPSLVNETEDGNLEVNFNKLKEELNDVNISEETYGLNWMGKSYARVLRDYPVTTLIEPDNKHNNLDENKDSNNVYIEGDNLEVLKHLKNAYSNKIKMIYIDPPYNTGSDGFVYNDSFNFKVEDFMQLANVDEDEAKKILDYTTSKRSSHSAWLTFMYPRLYIARELLKDDGVIFISIDDNEQAQLKLLCDEIFGEDNFIFDFPRLTKKGGKTSSNVMNNHDYLLCYGKSIDNIKFHSLEYKESNLKKFKYEDDYGKYSLTQTLDYNSLKYSKNMDYEIKFNGNIYYPGGKELFNERQKGIVNENDWVWRWSKEKVEKGIELGLIVEKNGRLYTKQYLGHEIVGEKGDIRIEEAFRGQKISSIDLLENEFSNDSSNKALKKYFDGLDLFQYSKPEQLIIRLCQVVFGKEIHEEIVLDFFSGSGTTGASIFKFNTTTSNKIRYILVQLDEKIENSKIYDFCKKELKSKNPIIPDIAKERIKRAAKKIKEENKDKEYINDIDFGFKVYKTIEDKRTKLSDIKEFDVNQKLLFDTDNIEALLTTWMLYDGYDLNTKVENFSINKYNGYLVESTLYLMDKDFSTKDLKTLVEKLSDEQTPIINRIVINEANFTNKMLAEINEQVFDRNIKEVNINVIKRV